MKHRRGTSERCTAAGNHRGRGNREAWQSGRAESRGILRSVCAGSRRYRISSCARARQHPAGVEIDDPSHGARDRFSAICSRDQAALELVSRTLSQTRFNTALLGAFATVAILLAAVGIYGVIAYNVAQRTKEIGIRMALGAQQGQMLTMILRQSLTMAAIGIAVGLVGAFAATRLLSALLFGVGTTDLPDLRRGRRSPRSRRPSGRVFPRASGHEGRSRDCAAL